MTPHEKFARAVLAILETDADWSADTLDCIASEAFAHGLGKTNAEGLFVQTPTARTPSNS